MQEVVIKIKGDSSDIIKLGNELKNLGKIDEANAKQFKKTNDDFKKGAKESKSALSEVFSEITDIRGQLINLGKTLVAAFAVEAVINFGKESVKAFMEAELNAKKLGTAIKTIGGEGEQSFGKLIKQSEELQAKGIFSDDAIQSAQTQLAQYGLFSNEIQNIIPLIADMAAATGMDLGQATDMVISGLNGMTRGLKSVGIEFKDTGSMAGNYQEVLKGLNKFQGQMDSVMETSTGKLQNLGNRWDDFKEQVGGVLVELFAGSTGRGYDDTITKQFNEQLDSVVNLQQNILPLADRYDELQKKAKLSNDEQAEMKEIINQVSDAIPTAISAHNNLGQAIAINTGIVRDYVTAETARLKVINKDAIRENEGNLKEATKRQKDYAQIIASIQKNANEAYITELSKQAIHEGQAGQMRIKLAKERLQTSSKEVQDWVREQNNLYKKASEDVQGYTAEIERLNGDFLKKEIDTRNKEAEELKKAQEKREADFKAEQALLKKKANEKEAERERERKLAEEKRKKEEAERKLAQEKIDRENRIQESIYDTIAAEEALALIQEQNATNALNLILNAQGKRRELFAKVYGDETDILNLEFEKQKQAIDERYGKEIKAVEDAGMDASALRDAQQLEQELAYKDHQDKLTEINKKSEEKRLTDTKQSVNEWSNIFGQSLDVFNNINQIAYNTDLQYYQKLLDNKQISEEQFNEKQKELARRKAQRDKEIAIFNTIISTARAVTEALPNLALSVLAGVLGAAQLGVIISQPEPKLAKGTAYLKRGKNPSGIDTIPAMLNEGEAVIPTERNLENPGLADAWIKGNVEQYINNKYVVPALKANRKGFDDESFINKLSKSMSLNAAFNDGNLLESDRMSRRLLMEQNQLLKKIANGSNKNPYRF